MNSATDKALYGYSTRDAPTSQFYTVAKRGFLWSSRTLGLFHFSRKLTAPGLRILCYHGFALEDEHLFRPRMFMNVDTFAERLQYLKQHQYPVLPLNEALDHLDRGTLPPRATVITIDDGFYSVYVHALPLLRQFSFPATIYVATKDFVAGAPIFRLLVQYMFWKSQKRSPDLTGLTGEPPAVTAGGDSESSRAGLWRVVQFGDSRNTDEERADLVRELAIRLRLDYAGMLRKRLFCLANPDELSAMASSGLDVQLHTHSHRLPEDASLASGEIQQNRQILQRFVATPLVHFCYPSGIWTKTHLEVLRSAGIRSATTCEPGLNYPQTPRLLLSRFLDGEDITPVEFAAEMAGYADLLRRVRSRVAAG